MDEEKWMRTYTFCQNQPEDQAAKWTSVILAVEDSFGSSGKMRAKRRVIKLVGGLAI